MTDRITKIKENVNRSRYEVVTNKAELFTEGWKLAEGDCDVLRTAKAQAYMLERIPIFILDGELIPIAPASVPLGTEADFWIRGCWPEESIKVLKDPDNFFYCTDETAEKMRGLSDYWRKYAPDYKLYKLYDKKMMEFKRSGFILPRCLNIEEAAGRGLACSCLSIFPDQEFTNVDYGYVLGKGLQAMVIINKAVIKWVGRYAELACQMAKEETDEGRRKELLDIAETCCRIPKNPAETFLDALTFQWLILVMINFMNTTPIGRIDQYTYPYWKKDMEEGRLNEEKDRDQKAHTDRKSCVACGTCTEPLICSRQAREMAGKSMTAEDVMEEILKDKIFYGDNGGVTFSGGEPLSQPEFLNQILDLCGKTGIQTAIETSGYASESIVELIFPKLDYLLIDIKKIDSNAHRILTGVSNEKILKNIEFAASNSAAKMWIRLPLIGHVNDSEEEIRQICRFLAPFKRRVERICLLPYHNLGLSKLEALDWPTTAMKQFKAPEENHMQKLKGIFEKEGYFVKL